MTDDRPVRRAVVLRGRSGRPDWDEVEKYLPANYKVIGETPGAILIEGRDDHGWTLDDYVIPRLGSGLISAREVPQGRRLLHEIHDDIRRTWKNPYFAAVPYIKALRYLAVPEDKYGEDDGEHIIQHFLGNAKSWRGEDAKRIKDELREMIRL